MTDALGNATYVPQAPAIGLEGQLAAGDNPFVTSLTATGTHVTNNQVAGGIVNSLGDQTQSLLALISSIRSSATKFVDLTPGVYAQNGSDPSWGNPDLNQTAVVFASGSYVNGVWQSGDLHLGGTFRGAGLLVVEVDDPAQAKLIMDGSAEWVGEVIIYSHKPPSGNNDAPLTFVGGGNAMHIIGGAMVLVDPNGVPNGTSILGQTLVKLAGNADIQYSSLAINAAFKSYPAGMSVRSWRKIKQ
jgi:hypothetical protein